MAEEEGQTIAANLAARPDVVRKDSRKVPGGFGYDDIDDLSPNKEDFEESIHSFEPPNHQAYQQNMRIPSLDASKLPALPPPGDSSQFYNSTNGAPDSDAHMHTVDEKELDRHLNDVESSFLPVVEPIQIDEARKGLDDTYLFDGAQPPVKKTLDNKDIDPISRGVSESPTPPNGYETAAATRANNSSEENTGDMANSTSDLETMSSSPTAAAAARTVSRAISGASSNTAFNFPADADTLRGHVPLDEEEHTPKHADSYEGSSDGRSTLRHHNSSQNLKEAAGSTPGHALLVRKNSSRRPKFLRGRHSSQHSSISSLDGSDVTLGADYALQSGGAVPAEGFSRQSSITLSRSISLGSMASGIEDYDDGDYLGSNLATLTEEDQSREREPTSPPETPRALSRPLIPPTDTIIARHVRNVQVPEHIVKEFKKKHGDVPGRRSGSAGPGEGNLTLREQNTTIEKLTKDNFALKLKIVFLSDRLDKLSDEGVKETMGENIELKIALATLQRENKALRKKVKDLEKRQQDDDDRPSTAHSGNSGGPSPKWFDREGAHEQDEELLYLRERVEEYEIQIEKLRNDALSRENEKHNLTEIVREMGERRSGSVETSDESDLWKDLLEQETARREQADEENRKLREENLRLRTQTPSSSAPGLNHTTNIFNITKKRQISPSRPRSGHSNSDHLSDRNGAVSQQSTLVEETRRECEHLRHENEQLRREINSQTAMLTSRNKEKERLTQELEDLKYKNRGGGSTTGESIFERSASRAHERSVSRTSAGTRQTNFTEAEQEDLENKLAELRDQVNRLKIENQDLRRELEGCMEDFEIAITQKTEALALAGDLQETLTQAEEDLLTMQYERDETLHAQEEIENKFEDLRLDAQEQIDGYEAEMEEKAAEIEHLRNDLADTTENFNALQTEIHKMSLGLCKLEDDQAARNRRIQELEKDLDDANQDLEQMEKNLVEANDKINRLTIQQESSQREIAFLREEQEGDKIKIGDLEAAKRNAEQAVQDERDRVKELEQRLAKERQQREAVAGKEKQQTQQYINELNRDASDAKDEVRKLRKALNKGEVEVAEWKQRLMELESNLREALGDLDGTKSSMLGSIAKLQQELETTLRELDSTRESLAQKEHLIRQRDETLETHALEARKLADCLDKERQAHRSTKHQYETFQKTSQHTSRTLSQHENRVIELEQSRGVDRRKIATLENSLKEQMTERNQLLLNLWNRLSALCGSDWAHNNSLINGRALPSMESLSTMLPAFSKNLYASVKAIETLMSDFKVRIKSIEKDLWKEYQTLEANLEARTKRLDKLEAMARAGGKGIPGPPLNGEGKAEISRLRELNRTLKSEVLALRSTAYADGSPSPSVPTGPRRDSSSKRTNTLTRHQSASTVETSSSSHSLSHQNSRIPPPSRQNSSQGGNGGLDNKAWEIRLRELEYKLKAEREARLVDRGSARTRLREMEREKKVLEEGLERERSMRNLRAGEAKSGEAAEGKEEGK